MKAIGLYKYLPIEDDNSLIDIRIDKPQASGRNIVVKVQAISVNPIDTKQRAPKEKIEENPRILGWDVAGIVEEVGPDCTLFAVGDEVFYAGSIAKPGCYSEYHLVNEYLVGKKPKTLNFSESAALPLTALTAYEGLFHRLGIHKEPTSNTSKTIVIIGAAGGVGSIAIQLAKLAGLKVIATASRPATAEWVSRLGADHIINHYDSFAPQLAQFGITQVDYIYCLNRTEQYWQTFADIIAPQGKICSIVDASEPLDLNILKPKSATFVWEFMFTRAVYETKDMIEQHYILNTIAELIDSNELQTTINEVLSPINAKNLRKAHKQLESGSAIGKIVLEKFE